jgi:hypothetical protein
VRSEADIGAERPTPSRTVQGVVFRQFICKMCEVTLFDLR